MVLDLTETGVSAGGFGRGPGRKMLGKIVSSSILTFEEENEKYSFVFDMAWLYKSWHPGIKKKRAREIPSGEKMLYVKQCLEFITL